MCSSPSTWGFDLKAVAGKDGSADENKNKIETAAQMAPFTKDNPRPESALKGEAAVLKAIQKAQGK